MGYACPVCEAEQADAVHLANHLAITASLGREGHGEWLEEYAPEWSECSPEELGERVAPHAEEIETPEFEGTSHGHDHGRPGGLEQGLAQQSRQPGRGSLSTAAESALQEAQEMTRRMHDDSAESDSEEVADEETAETDDGSTERENENA
ncbi:DUF5810 domain-containing protein [Natronorubrum daqingense]|uniref:Uncharacterized protein n=1 Tax=Natronorubrum daqingense TaxID=588898 RepID=A0A1N7G7V0_9EURY|nr:DUF5810 domain-containing protein [Natronorubrum daqingense]APX97259.1 hypothetical protein BB347_11880 [Natronorubrum daqingense]SIS08628.1 hypothetical protein SAMN05421809_3778 [Natronorubrum daqingense]